MTKRIALILITLTLTGCEAAEQAAKSGGSHCAFEDMALDGASIAGASAIKHVFYEAGKITSLALYEDGTARWVYVYNVSDPLGPVQVGEWSLSDDCTIELVNDADPDSVEITLSNPDIDDSGALLTVDIDEPVAARSGAAISVLNDPTPTTF